MKILFLSYNGLLEPILLSQALPYLKELTKKGFEFTLLTYEKSKDLRRATDIGVSKIREELEKEKIDWRYLKYHKNPPVLSTLFDLVTGITYSLYLILAKRIKVIHVRGITPGIIMIAISKVLKVKILFDMRGLLAEEYAAGGLWKEGGTRFRLVKKAEEEMLKIADAVVVLTQKHMELNKSLGYIAGRNIPMEVVPCCVDMSKFYSDKKDESDLKKELGLKDKFVLMYPGKIGTFYLMDEMLSFFKYMSGVVPNVVFFIVTHDQPDAFLKRAALLGTPVDKIVIREHVPFSEMPRYVRIADAGIFFINPYKKIGSSPIKMGEFLASGIPVIINPGIGDTEELVRDNSSGVVVAAFTDECYGKAVAQLLALKNEGEDLRYRCRQAARQHLSLSDGVNTYNRIYNTLTGS